uniref:Reverse transcriptase domain-containing protein n=1 Tax=Heligmosomoides polygyrus TaxID=6339 RepID=A0A183FJM0_HELPZ
LEAGALDRQQERRRRKRRLIIDDQKNIGGEEMKSNMADYSDTLQPLDLAPPTRRLMRMKESGIVEKLFHLPGCVFMKAKPLVRVSIRKLE